MAYWKRVAEFNRPEPTLWQKLPAGVRALLVLAFVILFAAVNFL